ncbi:hypothetical protein JCM8097_004704 [Rhodosporidiobolus ruineniae]
MSLSVLPPELKEHIVGYVRLDDQESHVLDREDFVRGDYAEWAAWDTWCGMGVFALSLVSTELRTICLPLLFETLDLGCVQLDDLETCFSSPVQLEVVVPTRSSPIKMTGGTGVHGIGRHRHPPRTSSH